MDYYNSETLLEQQQEIEKLKEQNAELVATVEALREAYGSFVETGFDEILDEAFSAAPQQHLRQVRADAGRDGFIAGSEQTASFITSEIGYAVPLLEARANQYHASILAGKE